MAKKRRIRKDRGLLVGVIIVTIIAASIGIFSMIQSKTQKPNNEQPPNENQTTTTEPKQPSKEKTMADLYYYDEAKKERYEAYKKANPDLSDDEVVWQVDVDMDKEDYTDMTTISAKDSDNIVLLVNKHFRLADDYAPASLQLLDETYYLTPETFAAFENMRAAASLEDITIAAGSTYRSIDYQRDLYDYYVEEDGQEEADRFSARPGSSEHHTGRAIDLVGPEWTLDSFEGTAACEWVHQHGHEYGFILRYQKDIEYITGYEYEPWHITYVGKEAATTMHEKNIASLEEYYVKYVMYQEW